MFAVVYVTVLLLPQSNLVGNLRAWLPLSKHVPGRAGSAIVSNVLRVSPWLANELDARTVLSSPFAPHDTSWSSLGILVTTPGQGRFANSPPVPLARYIQRQFNSTGLDARTYSPDCLLVIYSSGLFLPSHNLPSSLQSVVIFDASSYATPALRTAALGSVSQSRYPISLSRTVP